MSRSGRVTSDAMRSLRRFSLSSLISVWLDRLVRLARFAVKMNITYFRYLWRILKLFFPKSYISFKSKSATTFCKIMSQLPIISYTNTINLNVYVLYGFDTHNRSYPCKRLVELHSHKNLLASLCFITITLWLVTLTFIKMQFTSDIQCYLFIEVFCAWCAMCYSVVILHHFTEYHIEPLVYYATSDYYKTCP